MVGRVRATDALLLDVTAGEGAVTAGLRVPADNPSLFDHVQDHVPGMVLVEAARQLAALATRHWGGDPPDRTHMVAMTSSFSAYAELNEPVRLTAVPAEDRPDRHVHVTFQQAGVDIADTRITLATPTTTAARQWRGGST
jgi:hypothetical protein